MMIETIAGIVIVIGAGFFAFMSSHIVSEKKAGKTIPLPWEKKRLNNNSPDMGTGKFDKQRVPYRDGDNT
jgi:hypothetical protein